MKNNTLKRKNSGLDLFQIFPQTEVRERGGRKHVKDAGDREADVTYICQLICFLFVPYCWCYT